EGLGEGPGEVPVATRDCVPPSEPLREGDAEGDAEADGLGVGEPEGLGLGDASAGSLTTGAPVTSTRPSAIMTSFAATPVAGATIALWPSDGDAGAIRQVTVAVLLTTGSSGATRVTFTG
ncbi:hypothetical protein, partial [Microbispora rosea]